jgi:hypothetical protein
MGAADPVTELSKRPAFYVWRAGRRLSTRRAGEEGVRQLQGKGELLVGCSFPVR